MDQREQPVESRQAEGWLVTAIRLPVRIVVLVLVVPVRMVWDAVVAAGRFLGTFLGRAVLRPVGRGLRWLGKVLVVWPVVGVWRYLVVPAGRAVGWLGRVLVVVPLVWLYTRVLTPLGRGLRWLYAYVLTLVGHGLTWLYARVLTPAGHAGAWVVRWLYAWVLAPVGRGVGWCVRGVVGGVRVVVYWVVRVVVVLPALALWRWVLRPLGLVVGVVLREVGEAVGHAWRVAGRISLVVGRFLARLLRWVVVEPLRWVYRTVLTPVGHAVRDLVLRPAAEAARAVGRVVRQTLAGVRETVRQARADVRRLLAGALGGTGGTPREREGAAGREPTPLGTRTLDSSTTALTKFTKD